MKFYANVCFDLWGNYYTENENNGMEIDVNLDDCTHFNKCIFFI